MTEILLLGLIYIKVEAVAELGFEQPYDWKSCALPLDHMTPKVFCLFLKSTDNDIKIFLLPYCPFKVQLCQSVTNDIRKLYKFNLFNTIYLDSMTEP